MDLFTSPSFSTQVNQLMQQFHIPGAAVALIDHDRVASLGFGQSRLNPARNVTPDTLFDIASCSKSFTGASLSVLAADNVKYPNVTWNTVVHDLLPDDFVLADESYTKQVTIDDVIGHRTGIPSHDLSVMGSEALHPDNAKSVTRNMRNLPIVAPIRTRFLYNNLMMTVASYLVESVTGKAFAEFLDTTFFQPLGMKSTNLQPNRAIARGLESQMAWGYIWSDSQKKFGPATPSIQTPDGQGAGSIITSANDLIKWVKAMMNNEGPISKEVSKGLTTIRSHDDSGSDIPIPGSSDMFYAAGIYVSWYRGYQVFSHTGSVQGFGSYFFFIPELKLGGVFLTNINGGSIFGRTLFPTLFNAANAANTTNNNNSTKMEREYSEILLKEIEEQQTLTAPNVPTNPQTKPLQDYVGKYYNIGYHNLSVEINQGKLFINGQDRSPPVNFTFEHIEQQTKYNVGLHYIGLVESDVEGVMKGEFRIVNSKVTALGLEMDEDYTKLIWFDRVNTA